MSFRLLYIDQTSLFTVDESPLCSLVYQFYMLKMTHLIVDESFTVDESPLRRGSAQTRLRLDESPLRRVSSPPNSPTLPRSPFLSPNPSFGTTAWHPSSTSSDLSLQNFTKFNEVSQNYAFIASILFIFDVLC